ncbi:MAG: YidC/Oxa1 family membrane protein insertase [Clostridiales bacterium]|nr:YidC/Oxa1 family membrane protein insertase [Clostridiales bacterium]MCF8021508.1 YidC/Oxa1 family membrane protein insertase [Clostridiales bacterium]
MTDIINWLYIFTETIGIPSYAVAIVLLTIIIKLIMYPLTQKQMTSMKKMQQIQPKVKDIQAKYKDKDSQKMQQKIMELYKENNVNPLAGCLPIIVQMPILIALFRSLRNVNFPFINEAHAGFFWIEKLTLSDPLYFLPLLAAASTYMQTRLTTSPTDQTQKIMLYAMPLFIGWISTTMPAGLVIYWIMFNLLGYIQQLLVNKQNENEKLKEGVAKK